MKISQLGRNTKYLVGRGQPIVKNHFALIQAIADITRGLRDDQELRLPHIIDLAIGGDFDPVVVGHDQADPHVSDRGNHVFGLGQGQAQALLQPQPQRDFFVVLSTGQHVFEGDTLGAVRRQKAVANTAALARPSKADTAASNNRVTRHQLDPFGSFYRAHQRRRNLDIVAKKHRTAGAVLGRIVGQFHYEERLTLIDLPPGQQALEGVVLKARACTGAIVGVDESRAQGQGVAHRRLNPTSHQVGKMRRGSGRYFAVDINDRVRDPRKETGDLHIGARGTDHDPIEARLAKGHRCQRGADFVADHNRIAIIAALIGSDNQSIEPARVKTRFGDLARLESLRLPLTPIVDQPAASDQFAEAVVKIKTFLIAVDIAQIGVLRVVGLLPLAPTILAKELLRQIPPLNGRIERTNLDRNARS